jgi:DNA-binding Xre family transcriptional regulator
MDKPTAWRRLAERFANEFGESFLVRRGVNAAEPAVWQFDPIRATANTMFGLLSRQALLLLGEDIHDDGAAATRWLDLLVQDYPKEWTVEPLAHLAAAEACRMYAERAEIETLRGHSPKETAAGALKVKCVDWLTQRILIEQKITQNRFAVLADIDPKTVKKMFEGQKVQRSVLEKVASYLGCQVTDIPSN